MEAKPKIGARQRRLCARRYLHLQEVHARVGLDESLICVCMCVFMFPYVLWNTIRSLRSE